MAEQALQKLLKNEQGEGIKVKNIKSKFLKAKGEEILKKK